MSFLKKLLPTTSENHLYCPKCLTRYEVSDSMIDILKVNGCMAQLTKGDEEGAEVCDYEFPLQYLNNVESTSPLFVQVFGWTKHGKTVFLDSLRLMLLDMGKMWSGFNYQAVTEMDIEKDRELRAYLRRGYMPESTQLLTRQQNQSYIMQLRRIPRYGNRSLIIMDHAGERFEHFDVPTGEIPFLLHTPTTFMIASIPEIEKQGQGHSIDQLLNIYIETMLRNGIDFNKQRRKLIIVLTMADLITQLPPHLRRYLSSDNIWSQLRSRKPASMGDVEMAAYLERMQWVSDEIRYWMLNDVDGAPGGTLLSVY